MENYTIKKREKGKLKKKDLSFGLYLLIKIGESLSLAGILTLTQDKDIDYFIHTNSIIYAINIGISLILKNTINFFKYKKYKLEREEIEKIIYFEVKRAVDEKMIESIEYVKAKELYDKVIDNFVNMCKRMGAKTPMEIYHIFVIFYHGGVFSHNKYKEQDITKLIDRDYKEFKGLLGIEVFTGLGVCRHSAVFLSDIFKRFGFESSIQIMYIEGEILKNLSEKEKEKVTKTGNHAVTYVKYNGINYVLCPENVFCLASVDGKLEIIDFTSKKVDTTSNMKIISPSAIEPYTLEMTGVDTTVLDSMTSAKFLSKEDYIYEFYKTFDLTDNRFKVHFLLYGEPVAETFYRQNISLYLEILKLKESISSNIKEIYSNYKYDSEEKKLIKR